MNSERENFERLRRLLALKKYEQPPPGYFNHFSQLVIERIQTESATSEAGFLRWVTAPIAWMQRAWDSLENHPALAMNERPYGTWEATRARPKGGQSPLID